MDKRNNKLKEESLSQLTKRSGTVSPTTAYYSAERQDLMGKPPKGPNAPRYITYKIKGNDFIAMYLTGATEKYPKNYVYKTANPESNFQLEPNPSKTYELYLSFEGLNKLTALSKARRQKKKFDPNKAPKEYSGGLSNLSREEIRAFLWNTNVKVYSNDPSFNWQGFNYKLSQLGSALFPTNIAPTHKKVGPDGRTRMGWADVHPETAIFNKHMIEIFNSLSFYLNQLVTVLYNAIRAKQPEGPGFKEPKPFEPTKKTVKVEPTSTGLTPEPVSPEEPLQPGESVETFNAPEVKPEPVELQQAKAQINPEVQTQPQIDIKQKAQQAMATGTNPPIGNPVNPVNPNNTYPGNDDQNPETYDANDIKEHTTMWNKTIFGYQIKLGETVVDIKTKVGRLPEKILDIDTKDFSYIYETTNSKWKANERLFLNEKLQEKQEAVIDIGSNISEEKITSLNTEILDFVRECRYPLITFTGNLSETVKSRAIKIISETVKLAFPEYKSLMLNSKLDNGFIVSLYNEAEEPEDVNNSEPENNESLDQDSEPNLDSPGNSQEPSIDDSPGPEGNDKDASANTPIDTENDNEEEKRPQGRLGCCVVGFFEVITQEHIKLFNKLKEIAGAKKMIPLVILLSDPSKHDSYSLAQRKQVIERLSGLDVIYDDDNNSFTDALVWLYGNDFTDVAVLSGNDEIEDRTGIIREYNGQEGVDGHFDFNDIRIVSYGEDNPDISKDATQAMNAVMNNDIKSFMRVIDIPQVNMMKKMFYILKYEIEKFVGFNESVKLNEAKIGIVLDRYKDGTLKQDNKGEYIFDFYKRLSDEKDRLINYDQAKQYAKMAGLDPDKDPELNKILQQGTREYMIDKDISAMDKEKELKMQQRRDQLAQQQADIKKHQRDDMLRRGTIPKRVPKIY